MAEKNNSKSNENWMRHHTISLYRLYRQYRKLARENPVNDALEKYYNDGSAMFDCGFGFDDKDKWREALATSLDKMMNSRDSQENKLDAAREKHIEGLTRSFHKHLDVSANLRDAFENAVQEFTINQTVMGECGFQRDEQREFRRWLHKEFIYRVTGETIV